MKFLCVPCDEAMKLERVERPDDGSLSVVFACAACGNRVAMLTNPMETQLVRALDVRIGGRPSPVEPMDFVRSMLASGRDAGPDAVGPSAAPSGCPFSAVANLATQRPDAVGDTGIRGHGDAKSGDRDAGSPDCRVSSGCTWSPEAERRLERIPEFIRPMVRRGIEQFAADRGYRRITEDVMQEARGALGM